MDIEGSEIELFINDQNSLSSCRMMIMELHNVDYGGQYYSIDSMVSIIEDSWIHLD